LIASMDTKPLSPVRGFRFSAERAAIRTPERLDLALAVSDTTAVAAGVFTRNLVRAAPVDVAQARVGSGRARAIVVNSGCANACTGQAGLEATLASTLAIARALGVDPREVLPASTGVIGTLLPAALIAARAEPLVQGLSEGGFYAFAEAIRTTDRWPKLAQSGIAGTSASVLGIAKGAGMIHPDLGRDPPQATMLAFLFTDAVVEHAALSEALVRSADASFNACSVDGDTSTNDCVLVLASGACAEPVDAAELEAALLRVSSELARSIVADGEGAEHVAEIRVIGLRTNDEARSVARTIAGSLLVKTALFGKDVNWGRLLAAAGRAGVAFDPNRARIAVGGIEIVRQGVGVGQAAELAANQVLAQPSYLIEIQLGDGPGAFSYLSSDLGHGYVDINAGYRS
jgi:glutamate N-acetyltransferase / amino-acid N-acetyltransferase